MTKNPIEEQLSAWLDDELPRTEVELLAARLEKSPEYRATITRYGLIGSSLRDRASGRSPVSLEKVDLGERIRAALDEVTSSDSLDASRPKGAFPRAMGRIVPFAVAAAVALAAVILQPVIRPGGSPGLAQQAGALQASHLEARSGTPAAIDLVRVRGRASLSPNRLTNYLVYHGEYSGMLSAKVTDSHIVNHRPYAYSDAYAFSAAERVPSR